MTDRRWLFDGQTSGTTATTGNTLSTTSNNADVVNSGTGGAIVYDDTWSFPAGGRSIKMTNGTGPNQMRLGFAAVHSVGAVDATFRWASELPEARLFLRLRHASGYVLNIGRTAAAKMFVQNVSPGVTIATGTVSLPLAVRFAITYDLATGANSDVSVEAYNTAGTLLDSITLPNIDLGATSYSVTTVEAFNSGATLGVGLWWDSPGLRDGSMVAMGPYVYTVDLIADVTATRLSDTSVEVDWTHPADAPNGVTIGRAPGTQTADVTGKVAGESGYDPMTISGAAEVATGDIAPPYVDTVPTAGAYTYWCARTP